MSRVSLGGAGTVRSLTRLAARGLPALVLAGALGCAVSGCTKSDAAAADPSGAGQGFSLMRGFGAGDLLARIGANSSRFGTQTSSGSRTAPQLYPGSAAQAEDAGEAKAQAPGQGVTQSGDGFQLDFEGAEIAAVAKSVLGEILQLDYSVDPRVTGQISLSSSRPVARAKLLGMIETALKSANTAIIREGTLYRLVPASESAGGGPTEFGRASAGFGITVIPVRHVSVKTLSRLMENFVTRPGAVKADPATGLVLVQGTAQERQAALDAAGVIDSDVMKSQSVGIIPLANASPAAVIGEVEKIMATGEGGFGQGQAQFQPMERMNAILVVARQPSGLEAASRWIRRLDRANPAASGVKVYKLRHAQAKQVAAMLNEMFGGRAPSAGRRDQDALQPGTGSSITTAGSAGPHGQNAAPLSSDPDPQPPLSMPQAAPQAMADRSSPSGPSGQGALPGVRVTADSATNSLLIFASSQDYRMVEATILQIDRAPEQVAIEATIAEVTLNSELEYGVKAYFRASDIGIGKGDNATISLTKAVAGAAIAATVPGGNLILGPSTNPRVILNALHALTDVKILSSPSLVVLNNQAATLQVGNQVAVKTQSSQSTASATAAVINNITYKDTGIILRVQPRIGANGVIHLEIEQEISNVVENTGGNDSLTPTISQRRVKSSIAVPSGQTVLLAGLISETSNDGRSGLPGVVQWHILGDLLSTTNRRAVRNELIIFIRPQVMTTPFDAQAVAEEFRARLTGFSARRPFQR